MNPDKPLRDGGRRRAPTARHVIPLMIAMLSAGCLKPSTADPAVFADPGVSDPNPTGGALSQPEPTREEVQRQSVTTVLRNSPFPDDTLVHSRRVERADPITGECPPGEFNDRGRFCMQQCTSNKDCRVGEYCRPGRNPLCHYPPSHKWPDTGWCNTIEAPAE